MQGAEAISSEYIAGYCLTTVFDRSRVDIYPWFFSTSNIWLNSEMYEFKTKLKNTANILM